MTLILELPDNKEAALKAKAEAQGVSAEQYVQHILNRDLEEGEIHAEPPDESLDERPISEVIAEIMRDVSPEDLAQLPKDGATQVDHYVYGLPKRYE